MLFVDRKLESRYDFGKETDKVGASVSELCKEIIRVTDLICEKLDADQTVKLLHGDFSSDEKYICADDIDETVLQNRDQISLQNIIYRKSKPNDKHTAISTHLKEMGLLEPDKGTEEYFKYLQLLYFFYMTKSFVYPEIFKQLKEKRRSTFFVPNKRAAGGDYWCFILLNLFDDANMATAYGMRDLNFTARISNLVRILEEKINEDKNPYQNINTANKIREIISHVRSISEDETITADPVEQMIDIAYQYQMLAYAGDMIKNLNEERKPFQFDELDYELPSSWQHRYIKISEIKTFMKERDTLVFCFQKEKEYKRPEKSIRGNAYEFIHELIAYDQSLAEEGKPRLFTKEDGKYIYIHADWAAIIFKTYLDADENLRMIYPCGKDWKGEQKLKSALSSEKTLVTDLAIRLFVVAFHSEYLNVHCGHGYYWPLFECIYLKHYLLLQEMVYASFSGKSQGTWDLRLRILEQKISCL